MDDVLANEIISNAACWDGDIRAAVSCRISTIDPSDCLTCPDVPSDELSAQMASCGYLAGMIMITSTRVYILAQLGSSPEQLDAAAVVDEPREAVVAVGLLHAAGCAVEVRLVDRHLVLIVQRADDVALIKEQLREEWIDTVTGPPRESTLPSPPLASPPHCYPSGVPVVPLCEDTETSLLMQKVQSLTEIVSNIRAAEDRNALCLAEAESRRHLEWKALETVLQLQVAASAALRLTLEHEYSVRIDDIKKVNCTTLSLSAILPDGEHTAVFSEEPANEEVRQLLEAYEKAARMQLSSYLTTAQLAQRDRRKRLDIDMATRDLRASLAARSSELGSTQAELSAVRAKCSDLESVVAALTSRLTAMETRERSVVERARRREEELHAALSNSRKDGLQGTLKAIPTFDFFGT